MKKVILLLLTLTILLSLTLFGFIWHKVKDIESVSLPIKETTEYTVVKGMSLYQAVEGLRKYTPIDRLGFKLWLQFHPEQQNIQSGTYELLPNMNFVDVLNMFNNGKVKQLSITLLEGHTISQWLTSLSLAKGMDNDVSDADSLYDRLDIASYPFCANAHKSVEGCMLPDTYFYTHGTTSSEILKRALIAMQKYLASIWESRFIDLPIDSQYEALILASIIEKETAIESERSEIAGVFVNRLNNNMRLQTDPTVIYGVGKNYDGNITRKHLTTPTPYNTYVIKGLPITPIAMPNKASIRASLFPALTDSLYFVATGNGGHQFSTNLADHNKAVREYLEQRKLNLSSENNQ